mmetsp:Transcript_13951/g.27118  ORF Transcript_13951/g.27118 Transcript_13951/m.27118 type:complete len:84 (-) Transcript_13951:823-1074(-)
MNPRRSELWSEMKAPDCLSLSPSPDLVCPNKSRSRRLLFSEEVRLQRSSSIEESEDRSQQVSKTREGRSRYLPTNLPSVLEQR